MRKLLYLSLREHPWREILSGRKKTEYRTYNSYYTGRLVKDESDKPKEGYVKCSDGKYREFVPYTHIMFLRGGERMTVEMTDIDVDGGNYEIGLGRVTEAPNAKHS